MKLNKKPSEYITDEFLVNLVEAAKTVGWSLDYVVAREFVASCFQLVNREPPTDEKLEPYDEDDEDN